MYVMSQRTKTLYALLFSLFLGGCVSMMAAKEAPLNQQTSWRVRQSQLRAIQTWQLRGAIALRTPDEAWSASIAWEQAANHYHINIFGPLGAEHIELTGTDRQVTLLTADNKRQTQDDSDCYKNC